MSIHIKTYGCTANQARSEALAGLLKDVKVEEDIFILNTCSLKQKTENHIFRLAREKKVIIAGCFPLSFPNDIRLKNTSLVGTYDFDKMKQAIEETLNGKVVRYLNGKNNFLSCNPVRENKYISKIIISNGCLGNCSYCAGKLAHKELHSKLLKDILLEAESAILSGCKEIRLASEDTGCYGFDIKTDIVELVNHISKIDGDFMVRIGMMNPQWAWKLREQLVKIYSSPKVYKFLHIPVQSGDNKVLESMRRGYTSEDFVKVIDFFRENVPGITIVTDIIVGFPGEDEGAYRKTIDLLESVNVDSVNISRYCNRKGTAAYTLPQTHYRESKELSRKLDILCENIGVEKNKELLGKTVSVLFTDKGTEKNQYRGRTDSYKPVITSSSKSLLGKFIEVRITKVLSKDCLSGEL